MRELLTKYRGLVIFLTALPLSFVYNSVQNLRNRFYQSFISSNKLHDKRIKSIQQKVRSAVAQGNKIVTARSSWKAMSLRKATFKENCTKIKINLRDVLHLDEDKMTITVEPMITMGELTRYLIPKGYTLAVQVEMDDLTIGGLSMGVGIETTSHRHGFLFETIEKYELITATGDLVIVTKKKNPDLYYALPWSHGTLGLLVAVELRIIHTKRFIKLEYLPFSSIAAFSEKMRELASARNPKDYLEGLVFGPEEGVIMTGEFTDVIEPGEKHKINAINRFYKRWFYEHIATFLDRESDYEYIPTRHYFHRHTPHIFFQLKDIIPFAGKIWYRYLFAWLGAPKISLMKLTMNKALRRISRNNRVVQDVIVPIEDLETVIATSNLDFCIYPLWVCPVKVFNHFPFEGFLRNPSSTKPGDSKMYVDVGIYGIPKMVKERDPKWNASFYARKLEHYIASRQGYLMLYADILMTENEFKTMFNHDLNKKIRNKYGADGVFPSIYEKVIPESWLVDIDKEASEYIFD